MLPPSTLLQLLIIIAARRAYAQLKPTTPGPNETYRAGSSCNISWVVDTSGTWKNVTIDLMSGANNNMSLVKNVASALDGTDKSLTPYSWKCPEVDPYSAIYFYQFTNGDDISTRTWTTRFTIASPSNKTVAPENPAQPNGDSIPWGIGRIKEVESSNSTSSTDRENALSTTPVPASPSATMISYRKKPHGHKGDTDSDGFPDDDSEADGDDNNDSTSKTQAANIAGAKSSAARATAVAHSQDSSSGNNSNTEGDNGDDGSDDSSRDRKHSYDSGESNQVEEPMRGPDTQNKDSGVADATDSPNSAGCRDGHLADSKNNADGRMTSSGIQSSLVASAFSALALACL